MTKSIILLRKSYHYIGSTLFGLLFDLPFSEKLYDVVKAAAVDLSRAPRLASDKALQSRCGHSVIDHSVYGIVGREEITYLPNYTHRITISYYVGIYTYIYA